MPPHPPSPLTVSGPLLSSLYHSPKISVPPLSLFMMKKMEMTAKEEGPPSQLPVSTVTATAVTLPHPRQQAQSHGNIDIESESPGLTLLSGRCCFRFPCFGSPRRTRTRNRIRLGGPTTPPSSSSSFWDNIQAAENGNKWWAAPVKAFKKLREWSEIVAGPKWKTFIRRFNRSGCKGLDHYQGNSSNGVNSKIFQYDPLSYALNFDEGVRGRHNDHFNGEDSGYYPDFTSRWLRCPCRRNGCGESATSVCVRPAGNWVW